MKTQALDWEGCGNVADLGGLPTTEGLRTRIGAVVRSDNPCGLTERGWSALRQHGIRTIVSLRSEGADEESPGDLPQAAGLTTAQVAVEDLGDEAFVKTSVMSGHWGTPLYYERALRRWPDKHVAAVTAVARARPGGVLIHCGGGRDRTGIVSMLLLALVGVQPEAIAADYQEAAQRRAQFISKEEVALGEQLLARHNTTLRGALLGVLASIDVPDCLRRSGLSEDDEAKLRDRLLDPSVAG